jgi:YidC/Oxa1 family membrane protein insertase
LTDNPLKTSELYSDNLVNDEETDTIFTKQFKAIVPLAFKNGEISEKNWYYGPTDYKLKSYDRNIEHRCSGLGYFCLNRHAFIPVYGFKVCLYNMVGQLSCLLYWLN